MEYQVARSMLIAQFSQQWGAVRGRVQNDFLTREKSGFECAKILAKEVDTLINDLFHQTITSFHKYPANDITIVGIGGYGAGLLSPYSDVDIVFLVKDKKNNIDTAKAVEFMLYVLWDIGFHVSQQLETIDSFVDKCQKNFTVVSGFASRRYICGNKFLFQQLSGNIDKIIDGVDKKTFLKYLIEEQEKRQEAFTKNNTLINFNVKHGRGGTQDFQSMMTLQWFANRQTKITKLGETFNLSQKEVSQINDYLHIIWQFRFFTQSIPDASNEVLDKDIITKMYGYYDEKSIYEAGLSKLLTLSRFVAFLSKALLFQEYRQYEKQEIDRPEHLPQKYKIENGYIVFANDKVIDKKPEVILEIFLLSLQFSTRIHPQTLLHIYRHTDTLSTVDTTKKAWQYLFNIITFDKKNPAPILRLMVRVGVLSGFIKPCQDFFGKVMKNLNTPILVEDMTINSIDIAWSLVHVVTKKDTLSNSLVHFIKPNLKKHDLNIFFISLFFDAFHKNDKTYNLFPQSVWFNAYLKNHFDIMPLSDKDVDDINALISHKNYFVHTAFHRDITDDKTIDDVIKKIPSMRLLCLLTLFNETRFRSVSKNVWNDWTARMFYSLLLGALAKLNHKKFPITTSAHGQSELIQVALNHPHNICVRTTQITSRTDEHIYEIEICIQDRLGLLTDMSMVLNSCNLSILKAKSNSVQNNMILGIFIAQDLAPDGPVKGHLRDRIKALLLDKKTSSLTANHSFHIPSKKQYTNPAIINRHDPIISLDNYVSHHCTVMEIECDDIIGTLSKITKILLQNNVYIHAMHAMTIDERLLSAFYILENNGKITDNKKMNKLTTQIEKSLS